MSDILLTDHPYRAAIMDEVHARPIDIVPLTCRVRRLVFAMSTQAGAMAKVSRAYEMFCTKAGVVGPGATDRQHSFDAADRHVTWEFHTEFVTVTWRSALTDWENLPSDIGLEAIGDGLLIGAMRVDIIDEHSVPDRLIPGFSLPSLCLSNIDGDKAQIVTDFVPDADRFVRFELAAGGLSDLRRSIIARRMLEIETYRTMALLGLPLARTVTPELRAIELELTTLFESLSEATTPATVQAALQTLHTLSVQSGKMSERLGYRFAASHAYGDILRMRLAGLRESGTIRGSTLAHYIGNRVDPGLATCTALEKRLSVLSGKIERATGLLNVRIGVDIQVQNAALLTSIAQTARSQFLLQRTVEGLSTIAISYYLLGILSYAFAGPLGELHWDKTMALSIAAPFVVIAVWLMGRAVRRAHAV